MTVGPLLVVDDPLFDEHRPPGQHPERPQRLEAARKGLARVQGAVQHRLDPRDATDGEILAAHAAAHLEAIESLAGQWSDIDADTYASPGSAAAARRAAGGAVALVEALCDGREGARRGVALLRPPGHHAKRDAAMGFCLLNNAAIAAHAALARGLARVAIVDWDVHHGNGTQDIFWRDPRVLFVSLHQFPLYPGTGGPEETGAGDGAGHTLNVPLSAQADDAVYASAFERVVVPVVSEFAPELVIVSAGFDAHARDKIAAMEVTEAGYAGMARAVAAVADATAGGRMAMLLEGGYDLAALEGSLVASVEAMMGGGGTLEGESGRAATRGRHREELERARGVAGRRWKGI